MLTIQKKIKHINKEKQTWDSDMIYWEGRIVEVNGREHNSPRIIDRYGWLWITNIGLEIGFDHNTCA